MSHEPPAPRPRALTLCAGVLPERDTIATRRRSSPPSHTPIFPVTFQPPPMPPANIPCTEAFEGGLWGGLFAEFEPFDAQLGGERRYPCDVAAGPGEARHQLCRHRVATGGRHNGNRLSGLLGCQGRWGAFGHNDCHFQADQVGRKLGQISPQVCLYGNFAA
jgi:hypothetical protein